MTNDMGIEKIDLDKVDWRGSREFFESLGEALDKLDDKDESYDFTWVGKRKSIIEAGAPINKTFRPDVENSKNWDTTENLFIEGDNLDALKLLQESYLGKVKMIYIDPPYNTGKDFVYHDNFKTTTEQYDEDTEYHDEDGNIQFKKNEKSNGRYHSDWLSMMYPRLKLARNLLSEDGVIAVHIDENEIANLEKIMDEAFGEDNSLGTVVWDKRNPKGDASGIAYQHEYILFYSRNIEVFKEKGGIKRKKPNAGKILQKANSLRQKYPNVNDAAQREFKLWLASQDFGAGEKAYSYLDEEWGVYQPVSMAWPNNTKAPDDYFIPLVHPVTHRECPVPPKGWRNPSARMKQLVADGLVIFGKDETTQPRRKYFLTDNMTENMASLLYYGKSDDKLLSSFGLQFDNPKPVDVASQIVGSTTKNDDIIIDFFSGSATTAHAVMQLNAEDGGNRKWIMVQLPEETDEKSEAFKAGYKTIPEISRERIRRAGDKIASEHPDSKVDYGFRALTIADTNYKEVYKPAGELQQSALLDVVDNIKEDRSELDLLFGVLTASALELNRPLEIRDISGASVYLYDYFAEVSGIIACFAESISENAIKQIAALKPLTAVFRDSTFPDSQAKVNLAEHFRIISPETKVKVI